MKRKEIKWRREGRRVMTGRQDGVIFRIWTPYDAPEKGYSVSSNDTKGRGRGINTADHKTFPTWEAAVEFCQQIMVGEVDLETMRAEFDAAEAEKERRAIRRAVAEAKEFRGHLERIRSHRVHQVITAPFEGHSKKAGRNAAADRGTAGGRATAGTVRQGPRTRVGRLGK